MKPRFDHVGIAVASLEESIRFYQDTMGLEIVHREDVAEQKVRVAFLKAGDGLIELLEPMDQYNAVGRFIAKRGPGLHHVAFAVSPIEDKMAELSKKGAEPIESKPRPGSRNTRVCFIHPEKTGGALIELVEHAK